MDYSELYLVGLGRSGTHLIYRWLRSFYLKPCQHKENHEELLIKEPTSLHWSFAGPALYAQECTLHRVECYEPNRWCNLTQQAESKGVLKHKMQILLIRNPFNLLASAVNVPWLQEVSPKHFYKYKTAWIRYAQEALNITNEWKGRKIILNFDRFVRSAHYRGQIADRLQLPYDHDDHETNTRVLNEQANFTSFKNSNLTNINHRWKESVRDEVYQNLFTYELIELSTRLFEPPPFMIVQDVTRPSNPRLMETSCW